MKKFNTSGTFMICVYADGVNANDKTDAISKLKEMVKETFNGSVKCDWIEERECEAELAKATKEKCQEALRNAGYGIKLVSEPRMLCSGCPSKYANNVEIYSVKTIDERYIFFMMIGEDFYFPHYQSNLSLVFHTTDRVGYRVEDVFKTFWQNDKNELFALTDGGTFIPILQVTKNNDVYKPLVYKRFEYVRKKLKADYLTIVHSKAHELILIDPNLSDIVYHAFYNEVNDEFPFSLNKVEKII